MWVEQLGNPEVEQLDGRFPVGAVGGDEDVTRLEVAVEDEVLVRVVDGLADGAEEAEALLDGEPALVAVSRDGAALDVLHREVGQPLLGHAAVEEAGDVRMAEGGEDLALLLEAPPYLRVVEPGPHDLERDVLLERRLANGEVDGAHAALAEGPEHAVRPHHPPGHRVTCAARVAVTRGGAGGLSEETDDGFAEESAFFGVGVGGEEAHDLAAERRVVGAGGVEEGGALLGRVHPRRAEEAFEPVEGIGHGVRRRVRGGARRGPASSRSKP